MGPQLWSSAPWLAEAVVWMDERLADAGIERVGDVEAPRVRPWSALLTVPTTAGRVWFKATAAGTAFEAGLYDLLNDVAPDRVLTPIATDPGRGWLLLPDGGPTLEGEPPRLDLMADILPVYGQLQRELAPRVDQLLASGVADMRPQRMPDRFAEAVALVGAVPEVEALASQYADWCAELAASPVAPSLDHNDLHPANMLVADPADPAAVRFYDWGDAVVAHPFAALFVPLRVMVDSPHAERARDAYLEVFTDLAPRAQLLAEARLACRVARVARSLVWHRAVAHDPGEWGDAPRLALLGVLEA